VAAIPQGADDTVFDDLDKRVLRFTEEVTRNIKASETTFRALAERLSPRQLMELTLAICFYGMVARVMETFEVELEPTAGTYRVEQLRREG
jgi:alkylhydroperoxidase family enzyme